MSTKMSRKNALKTARKSISNVFRSMGGWAVSGPYYPAQPDGPVTERRGRLRQEAYQIRREWIVEVALALIGFTRSDAIAAIALARENENTGVDDLLNFSASKIREWRLSSLHAHYGQTPETQP